MKTKLLLILLTLSTLLQAKYTNCTFKNKNYSDVCTQAVKSGVSYKYANQFLASYFKTKKYDEVSWTYLQPSKIKHHQAQEKKANNVLVKYIPQMIENLKKYKEVYDYIEKKHGVNREIIAAILLKETKLGKIKPTHDAFIVFNTMVVRTKPNSSREKWLLKMGKTNMASIISHCYKAGLIPEECNLPSSYAGAVGIPQFMPNSFIYAVSYKNTVADLTNMEDAIVSAANFLHKKATFTQLINWDKMPDIPKVEAQWYEYDYATKNASFVYETSKSGKVYNCFTKGKPELQKMKGFTKKIMRYNNSSNYAVGVMRLAYGAHYYID
ncbi:lytic murein transglycosylase [Sulfurimonas sp. SAG-AH-194-C21]|nr:lytic murein transglycosylase [Sulfurimonas sp. SAG-AH-194-C21]MDF1883071.1 lytic murein transglycosylase [Sulfurimonas sp. SAG-AH-194-C21]